MKSMKITQDYGLTVIETSTGVRGSGASLRSAAESIAPGYVEADRVPTGDLLIAIFEHTPDKRMGQIHEGQAGA